MTTARKVSATLNIIFVEGVFFGLFAATIIGTAAVLGFIRWNLKRVIEVWWPSEVVASSEEEIETPILPKAPRKTPPVF